MLKTDKKSNLLKVTVIAMAMAIIPLAGHAAGLGRVTVYSLLGQPLKAEIEVSANNEELSSLQTKLASVDAFRQADVEYNPVLASLKFSRELTERNGHRYVQVTTDQPLNEPFINMLVELGWASGRLVREYTFLLDPPGLAAATTAAPVSPSVVPLPADKLQPEKTPQDESTPLAVTHQSAKVSAKVESPAKVSSQTGTDVGVKNHKVRTGDTLGKIAAKIRPEGVNLDQMLVALLNANKAAFVGGNMNRLKAGKILAIPDAETINQIIPDEAKKEVIAQAADFNAYRKRLALSASAQTAVRDSGQQVASGKITPKVEETAPAPSGKDKLEVSKSENAKGATGDVKGSAVADVLALDKALKEAQSRTAELEQNLSKLKQLAELKSKAGADLQQLAQAKKSPANSANQVPAAAPAAAPEAASTAGAKTPTSSTETPKPEVPVSAPTPKVEVKKVQVPPIAPEPEPGFIEENSMLVFGGGGILALLLGWMGFSAWKKKKESSELGELDNMSSASNFSTQSAFGPSIDPTASSSFSSTTDGSGASQFSIATPGGAEPSVDALSQADTFLAFGRTEQAEEVLSSALEMQPNRHELYLKLLGIYAEQDNPVEYESLAKRFREQTLEEGPDWEAARVMGAALDPQNALYQLPSAESKLSEAVTGKEDTVVLAGTATADTQAAPETFVKSTSNDQNSQIIDTENLDFDLDFDLDDAPPPVSKMDTVVPSALVASPEEAPALDFDFDLNLPEESSATALESVSMNPPLDIPSAEDAGNSIDFDFDLPLADAPPALNDNASDLNPDALDLDLDTDLSAPAFSAAGKGDAEDVDNPEVATKLELAAAYEEMGDNSGASELYQEALAEGSKSQQEFARTKLASLN